MSDLDKLLHDLKTKREHGAGNMITHMVMDEAHAEIIRLRAALDAQSGVTVKPLVDALKMASIWLNYDGRYDMQGINAALAPFTRKEE